MGMFISFTLYLFVIPFSVECFFFFSFFFCGGSLVLVQVKQVRGVLQSFYYQK